MAFLATVVFPDYFNYKLKFVSSVAAHPYSLSTCQAAAGVTEVRGDPDLHNEFNARLIYTGTFYLKKHNKQTKNLKEKHLSSQTSL